MKWCSTFQPHELDDWHRAGSRVGGQHTAWSRGASHHSSHCSCCDGSWGNIGSPVLLWLLLPALLLGAGRHRRRGSVQCTLCMQVWEVEPSCLWKWEGGETGCLHSRGDPRRVTSIVCSLRTCAPHHLDVGQPCLINPREKGNVLGSNHF